MFTVNIIGCIYLFLQLQLFLQLILCLVFALRKFLIGACQKLTGKKRKNFSQQFQFVYQLPVFQGGISRVLWGRSTEYYCTPAIVHPMLPLKRQGIEISLGRWPTVPVPVLITLQHTNHKCIHLGAHRCSSYTMNKGCCQSGFAVAICIAILFCWRKTQE